MVVRQRRDDAAPGALRAATAIAVLWALAAAPAAVAATATVVGLGGLVPSSVNARGVVVGDVLVGDVGHPARWADGRLVRLAERPGAELGDALAVGDGGIVVGLDKLPNPHRGVHALHWDGSTGPFEIVPLVPQDEEDFSIARDVDATGRIVGSLYNAGGTGGIQYGFLRAPSGALSRLPSGTDAIGSDLGAITQDGTQVLGSVSTGSGPSYRIWSASGLALQGTVLDLTPSDSTFTGFGGSVYGLPSYQNAFANDGTVLGWKGPDTARTWWIRLPDGTETQVEGVTHPLAVNAKHVVVGLTLEADMGLHAVTWNPTTHAVKRLDDLLPAGSTWQLGTAVAITDGGLIVGIGLHGTQQEGYLLRFRAVISGQVAPPPLPGAALAAPAARVVLTPLAGGAATTVATGRDGRWRAEVDPGRYRVALQGVAGCATGQRPCSATRTVDAQDDVKVDFGVDATSRLAAPALARNARVAARRGAVAIRIACRLVTRPCAGAATIVRRRVVLARLARLSLPAGSARTVRLVLTRAGRRALAARGEAPSRRRSA